MKGTKEMGKENSNTPEQTWVSLRDAAPLFGLSFETITNMVAQDKFPVPTYKLGRRRVIDKEVMQAFFDEQKAEGLRRLQSRPTNTKHR